MNSFGRHRPAARNPLNGEPGIHGTAGLEAACATCAEGRGTGTGRAAFQLQVVEARRPADLRRAYADMVSERANALVVLGTPMFFTERERIVGLAIGNRLPAMYSTRLYVEVGGPQAHGASLDHLLRRNATYVDRLLEGAKPADLPVEQPRKFERSSISRLPRRSASRFRSRCWGVRMS